MHAYPVLFALAFALPGCGLAMTSSDAMRGSVMDATAEQQRHLSTSREASTFPVLFEEVDRHVTEMDAIMDDMGGNMASMHCSGVQGMMTLRDGMRAELVVHGATIHAMTDLGDARSEIEHHTGTMGTMLGRMGSMLDGMRCGGGW